MDSGSRQFDPEPKPTMMTRKMKLYTIDKIARRAGLGATALAAALSTATTNLRADDAPSRINQLVSLNFASEYVTPRGMIVQDDGLTFQPLFLTLVNVYHADGFINSFDLVGGCWSDFSSAGVSVHPPFGNSPKTAFVEIDPIAGMSVSFAKKFTLGVTYTAFGMQILNIGYSQHLETKLSFDDSSYLGAWSMHPYFSYWQELAKKATDADLPFAINPAGVRKGASHPAPNSSFYFDLGVDPSYTFKNTLGGLKLEAPCRLMLPDDRFYGDYYAASSTVGLWEVGLKGTIPLKFISPSFGHWNAFAGMNFLYFVDDNLVNLNQFNSPEKPTRDNAQGFAGVSVLF
jgi:hypothetical protein